MKRGKREGRPLEGEKGLTSSTEGPEGASRVRLRSEESDEKIQRT